MSQRRLKKAVPDARLSNLSSPTASSEHSLSAPLASLEEVYRREAAENYVPPFAEPPAKQSPPLIQENSPDSEPVVAKAERPQPTARSSVRPSVSIERA